MPIAKEHIASWNARPTRSSNFEPCHMQNGKASKPKCLSNLWPNQWAQGPNNLDRTNRRLPAPLPAGKKNIAPPNSAVKQLGAAQVMTWGAHLPKIPNRAPATRLTESVVKLTMSTWYGGGIWCTSPAPHLAWNALDAPEVAWNDRPDLPTCAGFAAACCPPTLP